MTLSIATHGAKARGRSSDYAARPTNAFPTGARQWTLFVSIIGGSQLRDSPGFSPGSLLITPQGVNQMPMQRYE